MQRSQKRIFKDFDAAVIQEYDKFDNCTASSFLDRLHEFNFPLMPKLALHSTFDIENSISSPLLAVTAVLDEIAAEYDIATLEKSGHLVDMKFPFKFSLMKDEHKPIAVKCLSFLYDFIALSELENLEFIAGEAMRVAVMFTQFVDVDVVGPAIRLFAVSCVESKCEPPYSVMRMIMQLLVETPLADGSSFDSEPMLSLVEYIMDSVDPSNQQKPDVNSLDLNSVKEIALYRYRSSLHSKEGKMAFFDYYIYAVALVWVVFGERGFEDHVSARCPALVDNVMNCLRLAPVEAKNRIFPAIYCALASFSQQFTRHALIRKWNFTPLLSALLDTNIDIEQMYQLAEIIVVAPSEEIAIFLLPLAERLNDLNDCFGPFPEATLYPQHIGESEYCILKTKEAIILAISQLIHCLRSNRYSLPSEFFPLISRCFHYDFDIYSKKKSLQFMSMVRHWLGVFSDLNDLSLTYRVNTSETEHMFLNAPVVNDLFALVSTPEYFESTIVGVIREAALLLESLFCTPVSGPKFILHNGGYYMEMLNGILEVLTLPNSFDSVVYLPSIMNILEVSSDSCNPERCLSNIKLVWNTFDNKMVDLMYIKTIGELHNSENALSSCEYLLSNACTNGWFDDSDFVAFDELFVRTRDILYRPSSAEEKPDIDEMDLKNIFSEFYKCPSFVLDLKTDEGRLAFLEVGAKFTSLLRFFVPVAGVSSDFLEFISNPDVQLKHETDSELAASVRIVSAELTIFAKFYTVSRERISAFRDKLPPKKVMRHLLDLLNNRDKFDSKYVEALVNSFLRSNYVGFFTNEERFEFYTEIVKNIESVAELKSKEKTGPGLTTEAKSDLKSAASILTIINPNLYYSEYYDNNEGLGILLEKLMQLWITVYDCANDCSICSPILDFMKKLPSKGDIDVDLEFFMPMFPRFLSSNKIHVFNTLIRAFSVSFDVWGYMTEEVTNFRLSHISSYRTFSNRYDEEEFFSREQAENILTWCVNNFDEIIKLDFVKAVEPLFGLVDNILTGLPISDKGSPSEWELCSRSLELCSRFLLTLRSDFNMDPLIISFLYRTWYHTLFRAPHSLEKEPGGDCYVYCIEKPLSPVVRIRPEGPVLLSVAKNEETIFSAIETIIAQLKMVLMAPRMSDLKFQEFMVAVNWLIAILAFDQPKFLNKTVECNYLQVLLWALKDRKLERSPENESESNAEDSVIIPIGEALRVYCHVLVCSGAVLDNMLLQTITRDKLLFEIPVLDDRKDLDFSVILAPHAHEIIRNNLISIEDPGKHPSVLFHLNMAKEIYSKAGRTLPANEAADEDAVLLAKISSIDETYLDMLSRCVSALISVSLETQDGQVAETVISTLIDMAESTKYFSLSLLKLYPDNGQDGIRDMLLRFGTQKQTNDPRSNAKPISAYTSDAIIKLFVALTEVPLDSGYDDAMYVLANKLSRKVLQAVQYVISNDLLMMTQNDFPAAVSLFHVCCDIIEDCVSIDKSPLKYYFNSWAKQNGDPYTLAIARELDLFNVVAEGFSFFDPGNLDVAACGTCYWSFIQEFLSLENFAFTGVNADDGDSEADEEYADTQRRLHENRMVESRNNGSIFRNSVLADFDTDVDMEDEIIDSDDDDSSVINVADSDDIISIEDDDGDNSDDSVSDSDDDDSQYGESGMSDNIMTVDSDFDSSGDENLHVNMNFDVVLDGDIDIDSDSVDLVLNSADFSEDDDLHDENDLGMDDIGLLDRLLTWYDGSSRAQLEDNGGRRYDVEYIDFADFFRPDDDYRSYDRKAEYAAILFRSSGFPDSSGSYILKETENANMILSAWQVTLPAPGSVGLRSWIRMSFVNRSLQDSKNSDLIKDFHEYISHIEQLQEKELDSRATLKNDAMSRSTCLSLYMSVIGRLFFGPMVLSEDLDELQLIACRLLESADGRNTAISFFKEFLDELSRGGMNVVKLFKKLTVPLIGKFNAGTPLPFHFDNLTTASLVCTNIIEFLSMFTSPSYPQGAHPQPAEQRRVKLFCNKLSESLGDRLIAVLTRAPIARNVKLLQSMTYIVTEVFRSSFSSNVQVSRKTQAKLVSLLGSKSCTSHSFSCITELIKTNLNVSEFVVFIVDELRKAKSILLSVSTTFFDQLSEGSVSLETTDSFFINQIKLLRLLSLVSEVYSGQETLDIYREINLFPLWQVVAQQFTRANGMHTKGFATCIMLLEAIAIPAVSVFKWRESRDPSTVLDSKQKEEYERAEVVAKSIENFASHFLNKHKVLVNQILKAKPNLALGPLGEMTSIYNIMDFENKRRIFNQNVKMIKKDTSPETVLIKVHRETVFEDSYKFFIEHDLGRESIKIHFDNEFGEDVGGLTREWLNVLSNDITDPRKLLFKPALAGSSVYCVNEQSSTLPEYLSIFKFVGWMIAKAMFDERTVGIHFTQPIYKHLLYKSVGISDMKDVDEDYAKSLLWMLENDITDIIFENMCVESTVNGTTKTIELIPNGVNIPVTEDNKQIYVNKIVEYKLFESVRPQLEALREGFHLVLEMDDYKVFNEKELELMICGLPTIDIDDWHRNTEYSGYSLESPQIKWFWSIVASFSAEERAKLLQFCTGTSRVPVGGFGNLPSTGTTDKFFIHKDHSSTSRLPTSHTCMNQLDLPAYESSRKMKAMLLKAITEGNVGFGFV